MAGNKNYVKRKTILKALLNMILLLFYFPFAQGDIYKWVDDKGNLYFERTDQSSRACHKFKKQLHASLGACRRKLFDGLFNFH